MKNVYIQNLDIGKLSKLDAKDKLKNKFKEKNIILSFEDKTWKIEPKKLDFNYKIDKTVEDAFLLNKKANIFKNLLETLKSICGKKNVLSIDVCYDKNKLTKILNQISKDINRESKDATIDISKTSKEIKRNLLKHNLNCKIITNKENPKITKSQLENIDTVLGSYSTKFDKGVS